MTQDIKPNAGEFDDLKEMVGDCPYKAAMSGTMFVGGMASRRERMTDECATYLTHLFTVLTLHLVEKKQ